MVIVYGCLLTFFFGMLVSGLLTRMLLRHIVKEDMKFEDTYRRIYGKGIDQ